MKRILTSVAVAGLLFQGCTKVAQPNTPVKFYTPSKLSVAKKGSKIFINNTFAKGVDQKALISDLNDHFDQNGIFKTVNSIGDADIVINVGSYYSYRKDNSSQAKFNRIYEVKREIYRDSNGREVGGQDHIVKSDFSSSAATLVFTVSIYDKKKLQPLAFLSIIPEQSSSVNGSVTSKESFKEKFSQEVVKKLEDLISTKVKNVNVFLPEKVDQKLKGLVLNGNFNEAIEYSKSILPELDILDLNNEYYEKNKIASSEENSTVELRDMEYDLGNTYMYLISKESNDVSSKNLSYVFKGYKQILNLTQDDSTILATANSLGRLEFKAQRLNIDLGE